VRGGAPNQSVCRRSAGTETLPPHSLAHPGATRNSAGGRAPLLLESLSKSFNTKCLRTFRG
jgi:hypothetical protein